VDALHFQVRRPQAQLIFLLVCVLLQRLLLLLVGANDLQHLLCSSLRGVSAGAPYKFQPAPVQRAARVLAAVHRARFRVRLVCAWPQ